MTMSPRLLLIPFLSLGLLADTAAPGKPTTSVKTDQFDFAPGGTIRLNNSFGDLVVEGWDQPRVEITVTKSMGFDIGKAEAARGLESVTVAASHPSATELAIDTTKARIHNRFTHSLGIGRDAAVAYRIFVPRDSHLVINHRGGQISITGVSGSIEAANTRGDIVLLLPNLAGYQINAHTKLGVVTSDVDGANRRSRAKTGEYYAHGETASNRKLVLHVGFGGIAMKDVGAQ